MTRIGAGGGKLGTSRPGVHPHQFFCDFFIFLPFESVFGNKRQLLFPKLICKSVVINVLVRLLYDFFEKMIDNLLILNALVPFE